MSRYAPAREDGLKPYVVTRSEWGRLYDSVVYADSARSAEWQVKGRQRFVSAKARRATHDDLLLDPDYSNPAGT